MGDSGYHRAGLFGGIWRLVAQLKPGGLVEEVGVQVGGAFLGGLVDFGGGAALADPAVVAERIDAPADLGVGGPAGNGEGAGGDVLAGLYGGARGEGGVVDLAGDVEHGH